MQTTRTTLCPWSALVVGYGAFVALVGATGCAAEPEVAQHQVAEGAAGEVGVVREALGNKPHTSCTSATHDGHGYWFCPTTASWTTAKNACQAPGVDTKLVTIDNPAENAFVAAHAGLDSRIGASDQGVEGTWRWNNGGGNNDGPQFWSGTSSGSPVGGLYANWDLLLGQPNNGGLGTEDCGLISTSSGLWFDVSCTTGYWYVCEEDLCPSDQIKESAGQCGCGNADTDSDGDGTANCNDACPNDATRTQLPCAPEPACTFATFGGSNYFFCSTLRTHGDAKTKCQTANTNMQLAQIDSAAENTWIDQQIATDRWIDGMDSVSEGSWVWTTSGTPFWQGNFSGAPVAGAYTNWYTGQPNDLAVGGQDCLTIFGANGKWDDENCSNEFEQYICEDACPSSAKSSPGKCGCDVPDTDGDGDGIVDCIDGCPADGTKTSPGQCGCGIPETDGDGDGTPNCVDSCPTDPAKSDAGACGCGVPDTDADGDGVPVCLEDCDLDPLRLTYGQCGCVGEPFARPAGTPCTDRPCSGTTPAVCDGAGSCGTATNDECIPPNEPPSGCQVRVHDGHVYLFCTADRTPSDASDYCNAAGMELVRIDDAEEDAFVADNLSESSWIGANDGAVEGQWRWIDGDTLFWQGDAGGAPAPGQYANWQTGEPGVFASTRDCAAYALSGSTPLGWDDRSCATAQGFVCEVVDQCPADPLKEKPGRCDCGVPEDIVTINGQPVTVCTDQCPADPTKKTPGVCGCGMPESLCPIECNNNLSDPGSPVFGKLQAGRCGCDTPDVDSDSNGVLDCFEGQPDCGTAASPAPPGTPCTDSVCAQECPVTTVCNGAGVCGNPAQCAPTGGGTCVLKVFRDHVYWFCPGQLTRNDAQAVCEQDGAGHLVSIDDEAENEFVQENITGDSWTGGNQITAPGEWSWSNATCEDGEPFWDGDEDGEPHREAAYANWEGEGPGTGNYAVIAASGPDAGTWRAQSAGTFAFVCEKARPLMPSCAPQFGCLAEYLGVGTCGPVHEPCVPIDEALPDLLAGKTGPEARQAVDACHNACKPEACVPPMTQQQCEDACETACAAVGIEAPDPTSQCSNATGSPEIAELCMLAEDMSGAPIWYPVGGDPIACRNTADCIAHGGLPSDVVCGFLRTCRQVEGAPDECPAPIEDGPDVALELGGKTGTVRVCGKPSPKCLTDQTGDPERCDTSPLICEPPGAEQTVETIEFPEGEPEPTCPKDLFLNDPLPEPDLTQEFTRWDQPCGPSGCTEEENSGENHPYCTYRAADDGQVENEIDPDRNHAKAKNKNAAGSPSIIDFEFNPRLDLDYRAELGPLGLPDVSVTAGAGLEAKAVFNGGPLPFNDDIELVNLTAHAHADRCTVTTAGSRIRLFGHDFVPQDALLDEEIDGCQEAFENFESQANRASKAMRDAASLLLQYESAKDDGKRLDLSPLCEAGKVFDDPPIDFPLPVDCAQQPPESHLNEMIAYYEQRVLDMLLAGAGLDAGSLTIAGSVPVFEQEGGEEEVTLFTAQFFIGPIPVILEAFVGASYQFGLNVNYAIQPGKAVAALLLPQATKRDYELLSVSVSGGPSAQAFVGFFAGAGFDFGPVGASLGVEARLTLGRINLTVDGGAGLIMAGKPDTRPLGADLASLTLPGNEALVQPLVYELKLGYSAGLSAGITDILSGEVNARLRLKFFFFSKTYRQRLLRFNGFCTTAAQRNSFPCRIPILELGGNATLGDFPWATIRMGQLLPKLKYLPFVPDPDPANPPPTQEVDMTHVEELFYDRLCSCVPVDEECHSHGDCCKPALCLTDEETGRPSCQLIEIPPCFPDCPP